MAKKPHVIVHADEATDPETPPERLAELARSEQLKPLIAANPNTPVETLLALARENPREFLANPILPLLHLEDPRQLVEIEPLAALTVLRLMDVPRWLISAWSQHANEDVCDAAKLHVGQLDDPSSESSPSDAEAALEQTPLYVHGSDTSNFPPLQLPDWIALCLSRHRDAAVRNAVAGSGISVSLLARFARQRDLRRAVAGNANTPPDVLGQLSHDADASVREAAARNPQITGDILKNLARSQSSEVRANVAANQNTPVNILMGLAGDAEPFVRAGVAGNRNTLPTTLTTLGHDKQSAVRLAVAQNPSTPANVLRRLINDLEWRVRRQAQSTYDEQRRKKPRQGSMPLQPPTEEQQYRQIIHALSEDLPKHMCYLKYLLMLAYPDLPADTLAEQAGSLFWAERYIIARHPNADHATLKQLAHDSNRFVRSVARERLAAGGEEGPRHE
jgi:hypothetical protein